MGLAGYAHEAGGYSGDFGESSSSDS